MIGQEMPRDLTPELMDLMALYFLFAESLPLRLRLGIDDSNGKLWPANVEAPRRKKLGEG